MLDEALTHHHEVLVEEVVVGEEITVAVWDGEPLPVVRIVADGGFFDFEAKYTEGRTTYEVPAQLPNAVIERAQNGGETSL